MTIVFIVSLMVKLFLRTCQERLTFINRLDYVKYHLTLTCMEIVEITEQYCYSMNITIIPTLNLPGKTTGIILLKLMFNYLTKRTTNSCSYYVFRTNLVFVVYHMLASSAIFKLCEVILQHCRSSRLDGNTTDCKTSELRQIISQDLNHGVIVLRSVSALIISSYISNRFLLLFILSVINNLAVDSMLTK